MQPTKPQKPNSVLEKIPSEGETPRRQAPNGLRWGDTCSSPTVCLQKPSLNPWLHYKLNIPTLREKFNDCHFMLVC